MARAGFGLLSVLLSLLVIGLLSTVALTHSASLFATPSGTVSRCEVSGARPPSSPSSGQGC